MAAKRSALKREVALQAAYSSVADRWGPGLRYLARAPKDSERLYHELHQVYDWINEQVT